MYVSISIVWNLKFAQVIDVLSSELRSEKPLGKIYFFFFVTSCL